MFFTETIQVIRSTGGEYDAKGHFTRRDPSPLTLIANVQPLQGKELLILPEGKRTKDSLKILTDQELLETNEETGQLPDVVLYRGKYYEIHSVKVYTQILPHFESVAVNVNNPKGAE